MHSFFVALLVWHNMSSVQAASRQPRYAIYPLRAVSPAE
jgi:hypothetical protein